MEYLRFDVKCRIFLSDLNKIRIFETDYRKKNPIWNITKLLSVRAESFHVGGRTDGRVYMTQLKGAFRVYAYPIEILSSR